MGSSDDLRALTVRQPWAWALIQGYKDIENRSWQTKKRGWILLHAGTAKPASEALATVAELAGRSMPLSNPSGAIIGAIKISRIHPYETCHGECSPWAEQDSWHWEMRAPVRLATPVPARGALNLWRPAEKTMAAVLTQIPFLRDLTGRAEDPAG